MVMFRFILSYLFLLEIANSTARLYDLFKPHIYLGQDFRITYGTFTGCYSLKSQPYLASVVTRPLFREGKDVSLMRAYTLQHPLILQIMLLLFLPITIFICMDYRENLVLAV